MVFGHGSFFMGIITAIEQQKRNPQRVNVYLDHRFAFGLATEVAQGLRLGQELSTEAQSQLASQELFWQAKEQAIHFLSFRPRSVDEVERHLRAKGYDEPLTGRIIEHLRQVELVNDESFARYWVDQRESFKPRSQIALRYELQKKGVSRPVIDEVIAQVDEETTAQTLARQRSGRLAHLPYPEFRQKLGRYLQQRGFSYAIIEQVTQETWQTLTSEEKQ